MKLAVCSELLADRPFAEACAAAARHGYAGIEIAPFTLADDPAALRGPAAADLRRAIADAGLRFVGLHWLLTGPGDHHVTHPDPGPRRRSWELLHRLADLCGELGGGVMVLGSGRQREARGIAPAQAVGLLREGLLALAPRARAAGATVLIEALPARVTNVINTMEQAAALVEAVAHPGLAGMFDFHNCAGEALPWARLLARHLPMIRHVHLNDPQGGAPSLQRLRRGEIDAYRRAFGVLRRGGYTGWVSLEVFRCDEPPEQALVNARRALESFTAGAARPRREAADD